MIISGEIFLCYQLYIITHIFLHFQVNDQEAETKINNLITEKFELKKVKVRTIK